MPCQAGPTGQLLEHVHAGHLDVDGSELLLLSTGPHIDLPGILGVFVFVFKLLLIFPYVPESLR